MKIVYITETSLTNKSAYTQHVVKMSDAFCQLNHDLILYLPKVKANFSFDQLKNKYLLMSQKKFLIKSLIDLKLTNIFYKLFFLKSKILFKDSEIKIFFLIYFDLINFKLIIKNFVRD